MLKKISTLIMKMITKIKIISNIYIVLIIFVVTFDKYIDKEIVKTK
jgi:hypothetical protein